MKKLRWGILSTARIAVTKVIPAMQRSTSGRVVSIASRDLAKARQVAADMNIPNHCGSYEALLEDTTVDAIYIPLPNHLHVHWTKRALQAGKHVLCEKPLGLNAADVESLVEAATEYPHLKVAEAFMYRHHPQWHQASNLINSGGIGHVRSVHVHFSYFNADPGNIRNQLSLGGGALMDIGCYGVSVARLVFGGYPIQVEAIMRRHEEFGTDILTFVRLDFPSGSASITCGTQLHRYQRVTIVGTEGHIALPVPFNVPPDEPTEILYRTSYDSRTIEVDPGDQFALQCDDFARSIRDGQPMQTTLEESWQNMRIVDACVERATARPSLRGMPA